MSIVRRQANMGTNAGILLFETEWSNFREIWIKKYKNFTQQNKFENDVRKMAAIFFSAAMC